MARKPKDVKITVTPLTDKAETRPQWILVGGPHRSGTTMLVDLLNTHPEIGVFNEFEFGELVDITDRYFKHDAFMQRVRTTWSRNEEQPGGGASVPAPEPPPVSVPAVSAPPVEPQPEPAVPVSLKIHTFHTEREQALIASGQREAAVWPERAAHFMKLAEAPFRAVFGDKPLRIFGSKAPMYEEQLDVVQLAKRFDGLKILHIVRNPVDTIASSLNRRNLSELGVDDWHVKNAHAACEEWSRAWHQMIARSRRAGAAMLIVKYEDFAADFDRVSGQIAAFLGVEAKFANIFQALPEELSRQSMSEVERHYVTAMFAEVDAAWASMDLGALVDRFPTVPLPYAPGDTLSFAEGGNGTGHLLSGFSLPEGWGAWTDGPRARIALRVKLGKEAALLKLRFRLFVRDAGENAEMVVKLNGHVLGVVGMSEAAWGQAFEQSFIVPDGVVATELVELELIVLNHRASWECPPQDQREIGIGMETLRLDYLTSGGGRMGVLDQAAARRKLATKSL